MTHDQQSNGQDWDDHDWEFEDSAVEVTEDDSPDELDDDDAGHGHGDCLAIRDDAMEMIELAMTMLSMLPCHKEKYGDTVPTRWVLVAEVADVDLERFLFLFESKGVEPWDRTGMLNYVLEAM